MTPFYERNGITIYCGDCLEVMPGLTGQFDAVITDPPYGINVTKMTLGNGRNKIYRGGSHWDGYPPTKSELNRLRRLSSIQIFWGGNYFADNLPPTRGWLVWDKCTGNNDYADCELAWTNIDMVTKKFTKLWLGANAKDTYNRVHPTQKPVALMQWCIGLTKTMGLILDPYAGSGTTLVAALNEGRRAVGIELSEEYCKIAVERLRQPSFFSIPTRTDNNGLHGNTNLGSSSTAMSQQKLFE